MEKNIITINKKILNETKKADVTADIIVPDTKPDIVSIINTNGIAYIYKEDKSLGKVRVDGNLDIVAIYLADNGDTKSIQNTLNFSETIENMELKETSNIKTEVVITSIDAKVLNERKISITAKLDIKVSVFEKEELEIPSLLDEEISGLEVLKDTYYIKSLSGENRVKTSIKENVNIENISNVDEIIKVDFRINNQENKISYNKVLSKADADVNIIFLAEGNKVGTAKAKFPIMNFIDMEKITDKNICKVEYFIRNMLFKVNSKGADQKPSIACQIDLEILCESYEIKSVEIMQDMYGIKKNVDFIKKNIELELAEKNNKENEKKIITLNENIPLEDVKNVLDADYKINVVNVIRQGDYLNYECEISLNVFYETDNGSVLNVKNVLIPFMAKLEGDERNLKFSVIKKEFNVSSNSAEKVDCNIEILIDDLNSHFKQITMIDNIEIKDLEEEDDYKMFMYFAQKGDSVWKIAKKFRVSMNDIIKLNNLENPDKIDVGQRLYIMR